MLNKPIAFDLFCGLGGWAEGLLAEGYEVYGFDIERHQYGDAKYPAQLILQDVMTIHGSQFRNAALIVASPPCQEFAYYHRFPWKAPNPSLGIDLFRACFRIQEQANAAQSCTCGHQEEDHERDYLNGDDVCVCAKRHIPMIVENVVGAQKWIGRAPYHYGSFYLWGNIPALMPVRRGREGIKKTRDEWSRHNSPNSQTRREWSAQIAKIPLDLARHIARVYHPTRSI